MMDTQKELYNLLLFHLGETSPRGKKVIPKQHDLLKRDMGKLLSYAHDRGAIKNEIDYSNRDRELAKEIAQERHEQLRLLLKNCKAHCPKSREMTDPIEKARECVTVWHAEDKYGDEPYIKHLEDVVSVLERYRELKALTPYMTLLQTAGLLHDTVEDKRATLEDIIENFGTEVAFLVSTVTNEPGKKRADKNAKTYPKIRLAGIKSVALKLADRIANVESAIETKEEGLFSMYKGEYPGFIEGIKIPGELTEMWTHLDGLFHEGIKD